MSDNKPEIDLPCDLNCEDDEGNSYGFLRKARDPAAVVPGAVLTAGVPGGWAWVKIIEIDDDGDVVTFDYVDRTHPRRTPSRTGLPPEIVDAAKADPDGGTPYRRHTPRTDSPGE